MPIPFSGPFFQDLKDAYWLKFGELQHVMALPQFLEMVEEWSDIFKIRMVH